MKLSTALDIALSLAIFIPLSLSVLGGRDSLFWQYVAAIINTFGG
tara:strand:- start:146 stop:280 length:135 start_codon:yes stop_codon:yes gene_type:complete